MAEWIRTWPSKAPSVLPNAVDPDSGVKRCRVSSTTDPPSADATDVNADDGTGRLSGPPDGHIPPVLTELHDVACTATCCPDDAWNTASWVAVCAVVDPADASPVSRS